MGMNWGPEALSDFSRWNNSNQRTTFCSNIREKEGRNGDIPVVEESETKVRNGDDPVESFLWRIRGIFCQISKDDHSGQDMLVMKLEELARLPPTTVYCYGVWPDITLNDNIQGLKSC